MQRAGHTIIVTDCLTNKWQRIAAPVGRLLGYTLTTLLLLFLLGTTSLFAQNDYSGVYYIASNGYNANSTTTNYYLCPTEEWCYYDYTDQDDFTSTDNGKPFLTTYQCRNGAYNDVNEKAVWIVEKHPTQNYYYIKRAFDGKYIVFNGQIKTTSNADRMRVHLEALVTPNDNALFAITQNGTAYNIQAKADPNAKYWTVNGGNKDALTGQSGKQNGPTGYTNTAGIIGIYQTIDANSNFYFEKATVDAPTITNNETVTNTFTITAETGATIYYTTDGTTPTTSTTNTTTSGTGTTSVNVTQTGSMTVIKAIAKGSGDYFASGVATYDIPRCTKPVITISHGNVTITCATQGATIHFTTNGDPATASSTTYTAPFAKGNNTTFRAIATKAGYLNSNEAQILPPAEVSSSSEITDMNGNYILANNFTLSASIGSASEPFTGTIDGNLITRSLSYPLVAYADGATIKNVILDDVTITSGNDNGNTGAICNEATGATRIYNCGVLATTNSTISGSGHVGSIVGSISGNTRVINCYSFANVNGGTYTAGIVGYNPVGTTQNNVTTAGMVMNCMFYGNITGSNISPVYGGVQIDNAGETGVNNYNYYRRNRYDRETDTYVDDVAFDNSMALADYHRSWPADAKYLTRFEYYRSILNSNKKLCTWWINGTNGTAPTDEDIKEVGIAKWVLDPAIAPYPILKKWGKYPSVINQDPDKRFDPSTKAWKNRVDASGNWGKDMAPDTEGQKLGTITVTINGGDHYSGSGSKTRSIPITAMDTENNDYCYGKIQLPYYNEIFGDPDANTWEAKYGGNYKAHVVTGWDIAGGSAATDYNFADRNSYSGRVFAQGGYFYVPNGVTSITITAHWADAVYLCNKDYSIDRVNVAAGGKESNGSDAAKTAKYGSPFNPAGTIPTTFQGQTVYTTIKEAIGALSTTSNGKDVYNQAIVLIGNVQLRNHSSVYGKTQGNTIPFTLMSADLDFDNEPDNCLELQFRNDIDRPGIQPIRFDFLPVPELGLAIRTNKLAYAIGIMIPLGHFEITETAFMHTTQFEYDGDVARTGKSPVIINGGEHEMFTKRKQRSDATQRDRTSYFLLGGNAWVHRFAPGAHPNTGDKPSIYKCPVNVIGGEVKELYLSGLYRPELAIPNDQGNPICYIDGGKFGTVAGAGYDKIAGNVTFIINHSLIGEFYGGGINGTNPIGGYIDVTINNSLVDKYCGGPKVGNMSGKTVTTHATGTTFGVFYGGGNGGNSYYRQLQRDGDMASSHIGTWDDKEKYNWNGFTPVATNYDDGSEAGQTNKTKIDNKGYHAEYEFEVFNQSNGLTDEITQRGFIKWIQFGITTTGNVESTLNNCKVLGNFYGGGNLASVSGNVTSTLNNTQVNGNAFGAGYSAAIPTFQVHDKDNKTFPSINDAGVITDGYIPYDSRVFEWTNDLNGKTEAQRKADPTYQKDGKWYCYTWNSLENLGVVTGNVTLNIEGNTLVMGIVTENNDTTQSGGVFGGGDASGVNGDTEVNIDASDQKSGYTYNTYNAFGGGNKADVGGSVTVNMKQGIVNHDIYGGGALAHTNINNSSNTTDNVTAVNLTGGIVNGDVYGGGLGRLAGNDIQAVAALVEGDVTVTLDGTSMQSTSSIFGGNNINGTPLGQITVEIKKTVNTGQDYDVAAVFGGGNMAAYTPTVATTAPIVIVDTCSSNSIRDLYGGGNSATVPATNVTIRGGTFDRVFAGGKGHDAVVTGNTILNFLRGNVEHDVYGGGMQGSVAGSVTVNIGQANGSTAVNIGNDVYGGGALANTNTGNIDADTITTDRYVTEVNLYPNAKISGDVYGGGRGQKEDLEQDIEPIEATVYGDVSVYQLGAILVPQYTIDSLATAGRIFGCNNANGSPMGHVYVYVSHTTKNSNSDKYAISAVYGGGNEASYIPYRKAQNNSETTEVVIDGCSNVTIHTVYGGGNAASTPATSVKVLGAKEIEFVYGGGNGAGMINGSPNPGANVGYKTYPDSVAGPSQIDERAEYIYGSGVAITQVSGGTIHYVYGGSNTKGNVRKSTVAQLEELGNCALVINGIYGGGRAAYMEGKANMELGCTTGMEEIYGGSEMADVGGNVELTITSGHFDRVFGGNNKGGRIYGSITVNIEQTGCLPIEIDELYLGGNNAPYSVYGYQDTSHVVNLNGEEIIHYYLKEEGAKYPDPQLNIRSFKSIGTIYGGGNGILATMVGNPTVDINVTHGWVNGQYTKTGSPYCGTPQMLQDDGVINTVFGGGKEATVKGSTTILIGDKLNTPVTLRSMQELNDVLDADLDHTIIEHGITITQTENGVTYTNATDSQKTLTVTNSQTVIGANITGNVYGGGNEADVTVSTDIQIGPAQ